MSYGVCAQRSVFGSEGCGNPLCGGLDQPFYVEVCSLITNDSLLPRLGPHSKASGLCKRFSRGIHLQLRRNALMDAIIDARQLTTHLRTIQYVPNFANNRLAYKERNVSIETAAVPCALGCYGWRFLERRDCSQRRHGE
jgi:hypothetical protein